MAYPAFVHITIAQLAQKLSFNMFCFHLRITGIARSAMAHSDVDGVVGIVL